MDAAERRFWGRTPPEKRGVWGRFLRIKRGEQTQSAVRQTLAQMGRPLSGAYYSDLENGRADVNDDWAAVFVRLYGEGPSETEAPSPAPDSDLAALISEMRELVTEMRFQRATLDALVASVFGVAVPSDPQPPGSEGGTELPSPYGAGQGARGPHGS